jgi:hypothetical protein
LFDQIGKQLQEFNLHKLIYPYAIQLIKEKDIRLIEQCINSIGDLIALVRSGDKKCIVEESLIQDLAKSLGNKWRLNALLYQQVPNFAVKYRSVAYFLDSIICNFSNAAYCLKESMANCFCRLVIHSSSKSDYIRTFTTKYAYSPSCIMRQSYLVLIETATKVLSKKFFMDYFYKDYLQLQNDKVISVLFAFCKVTKFLLYKFHGEKQCEELFTILKTIGHIKKCKELTKVHASLSLSKKFCALLNTSTRLILHFLRN